MFKKIKTWIKTELKRDAVFDPYSLEVPVKVKQFKYWSRFSFSCFLSEIFSNTISYFLLTGRKLITLNMVFNFIEWMIFSVDHG